MRQHPNATAYWNDFGPRIAAYIEGERNRKAESVVLRAFALYSWVLESFESDATQNKELLGKIGVMLVVLQDLLRGLIHTQASLSPVAASVLQRVALEHRINFLFIIKNSDPAKYADLYARFADVQRVLFERSRPNGDPVTLSVQEIAAIKLRCHEWFDGDKIMMHWTADKNLNTVRKIADRVGLQDEYRKLYGGASMFVHGSSQLSRVYSDPSRGVGSLAILGMCSQMAMITTYHCLEILKEAADFFGVPPFIEDMTVWQMAFLDAQGHPIPVPPETPSV